MFPSALPVVEKDLRILSTTGPKSQPWVHGCGREENIVGENSSNCANA